MIIHGITASKYTAPAGGGGTVVNADGFDGDFGQLASFSHGGHPVDNEVVGSMEFINGGDDIYYDSSVPTTTDTITGSIRQNYTVGDTGGTDKWCFYGNQVDILDQTDSTFWFGLWVKFGDGSWTNQSGFRFLFLEYVGDYSKDANSIQLGFDTGSYTDLLRIYNAAYNGNSNYYKDWDTAGWRVSTNQDDYRIADGDWHRLEVASRLNDPTGGWLRIWMDEVLLYERTLDTTIGQSGGSAYGRRFEVWHGQNSMPSGQDTNIYYARPTMMYTTPPNTDASGNAMMGMTLDG